LGQDSLPGIEMRQENLDEFARSRSFDRQPVQCYTLIALPVEKPMLSAGAIEPSDEKLLLACRRGDAAAWEALVLRYQRLIYAIPRRAGLTEDQSADVFQTVFARLIEHLERIEQPGRIRAWLATTARREAWRVMRRDNTALSLGAEQDDEGRTSDDTLPDDSPLPGDMMLRLEQQHAVRTAVEALDERCRNLLRLLFYHPQPPPSAEIAAALDMPEGSIGPTRARCLQKLRRLLENSGL
jgi:RNA polymerase sigma factor (sigma-70 family)